ncbi:MAG TPA: DUF3631 domain-containing protein [Pseudonocardiaceae bacterium]|nr:DUF3631 domain-containing protein [Pseudonocardiaceae bacterium]
MSGLDHLDHDDVELLAEVHRITDRMIDLAGGSIPRLGSAAWWSAPPLARLAGLLALAEARMVEDPAVFAADQVKAVSVAISSGADWSAIACRHVPHTELARRRAELGPLWQPYPGGTGRMGLQQRGERGVTASVPPRPRLSPLGERVLRERAQVAERFIREHGLADRNGVMETPPQLSPLGEAAAALCPGAGLLDEVAAFLARFVAFPSPAALTAAVLWVAHAHAIDAAESTPRIAFLSPEPGSGKTRALEVCELLVPHPMHAVNATPAALFRAVKDLASRPTILFDEIDTVFGPKAKENEEIRGLFNAGHRRGAVAYRCVGEGTRQKVEPFPAYAAVALAGLGDLPDTLMSRAVVIRMRRRAPGEHVEPFRHRIHAAEGHELREALAEWTASVATELETAWPAMPPGITDRPADVWEPLLAIADAAGGSWPDRARRACVTGNGSRDVPDLRQAVSR